MATMQERKNAQKVLQANEIARSIWDIDAERLAAALTLMTPGELDRLSSLVYVAGMLVLPEAGEPPFNPQPQRARKKKESPAPAAAAPDTSTAGAGKEDAQHKPLPPKCEVLNCPEAGKLKYECAAGDVGRFCEPHFTGATPTQLREWHEAYVALRGPNKLTPAPVARKNARAIQRQVEATPGLGAEQGKVA